MKRKRIEFKSNTPNYYKEENGNKSNTIRIVDINDERFKILQEMKITKKYGWIRIIHKQILSEKFTRRITDITYWRGCYLISWKHPADNYRKIQ